MERTQRSHAMIPPFVSEGPGGGELFELKLSTSRLFDIFKLLGPRKAIKVLGSHWTV